MVSRLLFIFIDYVLLQVIYVFAFDNQKIIQCCLINLSWYSEIFKVFLKFITSIKMFFLNSNDLRNLTMFILMTERTPCRVPRVWQGILMSLHCSILIIHSTCLERQRTKAVDSLESPVTRVVVCKGSYQK